MSSNGVSAASNLTGIISFSMTLIGFIAIYRRFKPSSQLKALREILQEAEITYQSLCEENFLHDTRLKDEINESLHNLRSRYLKFYRSVHEQSAWMKRFFTLSREISQARKEVKRLRSHILKSARDDEELGVDSTGVDRYYDAGTERASAGAVITDMSTMARESLPLEIRTRGLFGPHPAIIASSPSRTVTTSAVPSIIPTSPSTSPGTSQAHVYTRYVAMADSGNNNMSSAYSSGANSSEGAPQRYPMVLPARDDHRTNKGRRYYRSLLRDLAKIHNIELDIQWSENQSGEAHAPTWTATATVQGHRSISFSGRTKDSAQEACAKKLLEDLRWL